MRILIVDDSEEIRELFRAVLEMEGYEILVAETGAQALKLAAERSPALVLTDVIMPGMSGLELITRLRSDLVQPPLIAALSGFPDVANEALARGAILFLPKPIDVPDLLGAIRKLLGDRHAEGVEQDQLRSHSLARRAEVTEKADQFLRAVADYPHSVERQRFLARWMGATLESDCVVLLVKDGKVRITATSAPDRYPGEAPPPELIRLATDVLETGASLLVGGEMVRRVLQLPMRHMLAAPIRYRDLPVGVACLLRDGDRGFETADLRALELVADLGSKALSRGAQRLLEDNYLLSRSSFEQVVGVLSLRSRPNQSLWLAAMRTRVTLRGTTLPDDDPLFSDPAATLAQLDDRRVGILLFGQGSPDAHRARIKKVFERLEERWGLEAAVVVTYELPPRQISGVGLVRQLYDLLEMLAVESDGGLCWVKQEVTTDLQWHLAHPGGPS